MTKDQAQIISVSASAGSGKTYNLAKRYIELIFADNQIKNIVAITFANKAALEMKSRVIEYLKKAALNVDTQKIFDSLDDKQNKSIMLLEKILNDYDDFNISTIDSFKNNLLKACAFNLNLSPEFTIENKYDEYLRFAVEAFVRKANKNAEAKKLLLDYLDQYTLFEKNSWFPKEDIFRETKGVFSKSSNYGKDIKITKEQGKDKPFSSASSFNLEFRKFSDSLHDLALSLHNRIKELNLKVGVRFMKSLEKFIAETNKACHKLDFSREFLKPELKGADGDDKIISLWASISEEIEALIDFNMSHYYSVYLRLYSFIIREFNLQTKKNELILLAEINRKTLLLFDTDKVQVPEVYYRLSERYKHFLLDEFQDTNSAQWIGIRRFLEESIPNGGSLFYVGDVKQAIYDFRGGDPRIFLNIKNEFSQYKYEERVLIENYRSHKAIVDFNNFVFSKSNLDECLGSLDETLNNETILEAYKDSCQNPLPHKTDGYVEVDILSDDKNDEDKLKETLLSIVDDLIGRFEFQDIAILCNKNIEAAKTALWLMEKNLPVESVQNLNIRGNAFIKQIMSLIKFISSPIDKLSFASFVIGEIFLKESAMTKGEIVDFLFQNRDKTKSKTIYTDFRKAYPQIWDKYVEEFFVKAGFIPLYELLVLVLDKFHVINNFPESKIFILRFLELIKDFEVKDCGIKNFIEFFENIDDTDESLFIKNPAGAGIKIMTVHKAKGLQFPAVILPYASLASSKINTPCFIDSDETIELVKCPTKAAKDFSQKAEQIYRYEKTKGFLSDLNALYVSMTRAELEMRIIVLPKDGVQKNAVKTLFAGFPNKSGQKTKHLAKTKDSEDLRLEDSFEGQYKDIRDVFVDDRKHSFNLRIDKIRSRKKGTIIHFALSKIKTLKGKDENLEIKKVAEIAAAKFPNEDISFVTDDLKSIFADKEIREVFNHDEDLVFNEKEVVDLTGRTIRIDKIIEDGDKVLIFDFKSSAANLKDNTDQIDRYVDVLSQIYPAKKAKGFVVDLQNKKIIEVA